VDEVVTVGGVPGGGGGHEPQLAGTVVLDQPGVPAGGLEGAIHGRGVETAGAIDPVAQAHHLQVALEVDEPVRGLVAAGDQQTDGVGSAVDGGHGRAHRSSWSYASCRWCLSAGAAAAASADPQRHTRPGAAPSMPASTSSATGLMPGP